MPVQMMFTFSRSGLFLKDIQPCYDETFDTGKRLNQWQIVVSPDDRMEEYGSTRMRDLRLQ
jgi:hypothetical protein